MNENLSKKKKIFLPLFCNSGHNSIASVKVFLINIYLSCVMIQFLKLTNCVAIPQTHSSFKLFLLSFLLLYEVDKSLFCLINSPTYSLFAVLLPPPHPLYLSPTSTKFYNSLSKCIFTWWYWNISGILTAYIHIQSLSADSYRRNILLSDNDFFLHFILFLILCILLLLHSPEKWKMGHATYINRL